MNNQLQQQQQQQEKRTRIRRQPINSYTKTVDIDNTIIVACSGCGIPKPMFLSAYNKSKSKKFYHDFECYRKNNMKNRTVGRPKGARGRPKATSKAKVNVICSGCGIGFIIFKSRFKLTKGNNFYHNHECRTNHIKSKPKSETIWVTLNCSGCGIPITMYRSNHARSKSGNYYHNRDCFTKNGNSYGSQKTFSKYLENYRCKSCGKFIKKTEAPIHTTPTGRTYPVCPNINCGHYPLQIKPRNSKQKARLREEASEKNGKKENEINKYSVTLFTK